MKYKINNRITRALLFVFLTLVVNYLVYSEESSSFESSYVVKPTCLSIVDNSNTCNIEDTKKEFSRILDELANKIVNSDVKFFKNSVLFNIFVENNLTVESINASSTAALRTVFGVDKNGKYIEVESGDKKEILTNLNIRDLINYDPLAFTAKLINADELNKAKNDSLAMYYRGNEGLKFRIELSWINFLFFLIISVPAAWGIILLYRSIGKFILDDPSPKEK